MVELSLHDLGELNLKRLDGSDRRDVVVPSKSVDVELSVGDVRNIVVLEVQDLLSVLDDGRRVRGDEVLDGLGRSIVREEGSRGSLSDVRPGAGSRRDGEVRRSRSTRGHFIRAKQKDGLSV